MYDTDLAYIHDVGFGALARRVAPELLRLLKRHGIDRGTIVEVGCGSGIVAKRLSEAGYRVRGLDLSPAMIKLARARAPRATFRVASLADAPIPPCDAVVCVGEVVTYVDGGLGTLRAFFRRVHAALPPGGLLVFDFIHSARGRTFAVKTSAGPGWAMAAHAVYNARTRQLRRRIVTMRTTKGRTRNARETHVVHVYEKPAVVAALRRIGFRVQTGRSIGRYRLLTGDTAVVARRV